MFNLLKARINHGFQGVANITGATLDPRFRGLPTLSCDAADPVCLAHAASGCPSGAFRASPFSLDLGRCHFCGECAQRCNAVSFSNAHHLATSSREGLVVDAATDYAAYKKRAWESRLSVRRLFGRSFKLRSVSAGGCGACEWELNATTNVNFDMQRFGFDIVASPRHADAVIVTGPVSSNMAEALADTWEATPAPKLLILMGACAISGGVFASSEAIDRSFLDKHRPDIFIPGCPPHPLTVINAILDYLGKPEKP